MAKAEQMVLFDRRFLATYAGNAVLNDPRTALVELVANSWDAGSTNIEIDWPNRDRQVPFRISDNGIGMLEEEFKRRWITLSYDRIEEQGEFVVIQGDKAKKKRKVYGRNGVGRYAGFCFGEKYVVKTWKEGKEVTFRVSKGTSTPTKIEKINER